MDDAVRLAVGFLARRDRTVAQVQQFLIAQGVAALQVKRTIRRLSDLRYLNDQAYAQRWVENRLARRPMGQERLKVELQGKGIPEVLADQVVASVFRTLDEERLAERLLKGKQRTTRQLTSRQMARFLHQRGFGEDTIDRMIRASNLKEEELHEE